MRGRHCFASSVGRHEKLHYIAARPTDQGNASGRDGGGADPIHRSARVGTTRHSAIRRISGRICRRSVRKTGARRCRIAARAHHDRRTVRPALGDQGPGAAYNAAAKFYRVYRVAPTRRRRICASRTSATTVDTRAAADPKPGRPIAALHDAAATRRHRLVGIRRRSAFRRTAVNDATNQDATRRCARRVPRLGVPTSLCSCRIARSVISPTVLVAAVSGGSHGMPTVVMGCARGYRRILSACRDFHFSDFPLGNSAGKPFDERLTARNPCVGACVVRSGHFAHRRHSCRSNDGATMTPGRPTS